jgi:hypothetical protein
MDGVVSDFLCKTALPVPATGNSGALF